MKKLNHHWNNMKVHGSKLTSPPLSQIVFNPVKTGSLNDLTDLKFSFHVSMGHICANFPHVAQKED
jgi:hypothetical protein